MKRSYPSGASKRKKVEGKRKKKEELPKLTAYFPIPTASSAAAQGTVPTSSATIAPILQSLDAAEESERQNLVQDGVYEENNESQNLPAVPGQDLDISQLKDPGLWNIPLSDVVKDQILKRDITWYQNKDADFTKTSRVYKESNASEKIRHLTKTVFYKQLDNTETVERKWLIFSPSKNVLFCFICRLFSSEKLSFSKEGFNDWKHASRSINEHENSPEHRKCVIAYSVRKHENSRIDKELILQYNNEVTYWQKVLERIVAAVKFLASRGLAFRGNNQIIGSLENGNYLGVLELIAEFDPFFKEHLNKYGNLGKGTPSYLSANICEEFLAIMGKQVLSIILSEINKAKYYSISIDSTPDVSHTDQLTFIIRYVKDSEPVERFIQFIPITEHKSEYLANVVLKFLQDNNIPIENCRGQSYDNAANMAGQYSGLQSRVKEMCDLAFFSPCAAHSLNLVGVSAASCVPEANRFFLLLARVYTFFSSSTYKWNCLRQKLGDKKVVKNLSDTRWSARTDSTEAFVESYEEIKVALTTLHEDPTQSADSKIEAQSLLKKVRKLETSLLAMLWRDILHRFNAVSKTLQTENLQMDVAVNLLESLCKFVKDLRQKFDVYESKAKKFSEISDYSDAFVRGKKRSTQCAPYEGSGEDVRLHGSNKFRVETFLPIIDTLTSELERRTQVYHGINNRFGFFTKLSSLQDDQIENHCEALCDTYKSDLNRLDLKLECVHLKHYLQAASIGDSTSILSIYSILISYELISSFPNVEIALRIFLTFMVTNCSGERSFSKLKLIKNELRNTMLQPRLNTLALMCIERELLCETDFSDIIKLFSEKKSRKKPFKYV